MAVKILCIAGPTASGKTSRSIEEALTRNGEIISVDSRQVYRGLNIGTEKVTPEEMRGVPHHLIDIREPEDAYSAGAFVSDATQLIESITARGKLPILAGGSHFYFDALLRELPSGVDADPALREELEQFSSEELYKRVSSADALRAAQLDPRNRRRLIRALEIIHSLGTVPPRPANKPLFETRVNLVENDLADTTCRQLLPTRSVGTKYEVEWIVIDRPREELRARIDTRLAETLERGLIDEVHHVRERVGDTRLNEFGLEYRIVGEYLRGERTEESLLPTLSSKLWHYARSQKAWLRKLESERTFASPIAEVPLLPGKN